MPADFDRLYDSLQQAAVWSHDMRARVEMTGSDRATLLHNLCTNDIRGLTPGDACEAFLTNVQGKIVAFVVVFCGDGSLVLDARAGQAERIIAHLDRYLINEDVELHDRSESWPGIVLVGPKADHSLDSVVEWSRRRSTANPCCGVAMLDSHALRVQRTSRFGEGTLQVAATDASHLEQLIERLEAVGVVGCDDPQVLHVRRVEAGFPEYGLEIDDTRLPQEIDRDERAISFTKGCYLGQETVARIDALGHVNWLLRGLTLSGDAGDVPETLEADEKTVARVVGTPVHSPRLNATLAMAYVRHQHAEPGQVIQTSTGPVGVVSLPLQGG